MKSELAKEKTKKEREHIAKRLVWMARPDEFNSHTCQLLNDAAQLIDPEVEVIFVVKKDHN